MKPSNFHHLGRVDLTVRDLARRECHLARAVLGLAVTGS
jgi:hypothetical protein